MRYNLIIINNTTKNMTKVYWEKDIRAKYKEILENCSYEEKMRNVLDKNITFATEIFTEEFDLNNNDLLDNTEWTRMIKKLVLGFYQKNLEFCEKELNIDANKKCYDFVSSEKDYEIKINFCLK